MSLQWKVPGRKKTVFCNISVFEQAGVMFCRTNRHDRILVSFFFLLPDRFKVDFSILYFHFPKAWFYLFLAKAHFANMINYTRGMDK